MHGDCVHNMYPIPAVYRKMFKPTDTNIYNFIHHQTTSRRQ